MENQLIQSLSDAMLCYKMLVWHSSEVEEETAELLKTPIKSIIKTLHIYLENCDCTKLDFINNKALVYIHNTQFNFVLFPPKEYNIDEFIHNFISNGEGFVNKETLEVFKKSKMYKENQHIKLYSDHESVYKI
jgi:hypothetical protein